MRSALVERPNPYIRDKCICGYIRARIYLKNSKAKDTFSRVSYNGNGKDGRTEKSDKFMDFIRKHYGTG